MGLAVPAGVDNRINFQRAPSWTGSRRNSRKDGRMLTRGPTPPPGPLPEAERGRKKGVSLSAFPLSASGRGAGGRGWGRALAGLRLAAQQPNLRCGEYLSHPVPQRRETLRGQGQTVTEAAAGLPVVFRPIRCTLTMSRPSGVCKAQTLVDFFGRQNVVEFQFRDFFETDNAQGERQGEDETRVRVKALGAVIGQARAPQQTLEAAHQVVVAEQTEDASLAEAEAVLVAHDRTGRGGGKRGVSL